jgi:hypothetical protein
MSSALIAYVAWDRVVPWKILSLPEKDDAPFTPIGYGSRQAVLRKRALPDSFLWVITIPTLRSHAGRLQILPPTLVARIEIAALCSKDDCPAALRTRGIGLLLNQWTWVAVAKPGNSRFYELNDASPALQQLGMMEARETLNLSIAKRFQSIRHVPDAARAQAAFESLDLQAQHKTVFISYTHAEGAIAAQQLASELSVLGFHLWMDALTIPFYNVKKEDDCRPHRLQQLIRLGIRKTQLAIILNTPAYASKTDACGFNWTQWEYELILEKKRINPSFRCMEIDMGGKPLTGNLKRLSGKLSGSLGKAIADAWGNTGQPD